MTEENRQDRESIKLIKNTKGWNYEIKILNTEGKQLNDEDIRRLDHLKQLLEEKYGVSN